MSYSDNEVKKELYRMVMYKGVFYGYTYAIDKVTNKERIISKCPEGLFQGLKISRLGNFNQYSDNTGNSDFLNFVTIVYKEHAEEAVDRFLTKCNKVNRVKAQRGNIL